MSELLLLVVMALASYRLWRVVGLDHWPPSEWFRNELDELALTERGRDAEGWRAYLLEEAQTLITCPWCLGAWVALAVVLWVDLLVGLELPLLQWLAVSTIVGLVGSVDG